MTALFSSNCKLFKSCCFGSLGPKGRNWLDVTVVDWEEGGTAVARLGMEGKKESCMVDDSAGLGLGISVGDGKPRLGGVTVVEAEKADGKGVVDWKWLRWCCCW